jgi:L-ascorbate metabolism protein UlaG (beta-lactamase superfamily)
LDGQRRFVNLDGSTPLKLGAVLRWAVVDRLLGRRRRSPPRAPVPDVAPDLDRLRRPPGPGEPARLTWLGHASWLVQLDGVSLLIDPALGPTLFGGTPRNVAPGLGIADLPHIDSQLVSHSHYDHLDVPTLTAVKAPVIAGLRLERLFRRIGLPCTELGWWETANLREVRVTFVPAQHWSRRGPFDGNRTLWGGFVIQGGGATIYHSGDTAWFEGFSEIGRRFPGLDAALLPIGAYDPAWFMERQHMNPEQALRAFEALGARTFLAMHWGTFKLTDEPLDEPPARLEAERVRLGLPAERVRVLAVGETIELGGPASVPPPRAPSHRSSQAGSEGLGVAAGLRGPGGVGPLDPGRPE